MVLVGLVASGTSDVSDYIRYRSNDHGCDPGHAQLWADVDG